MQTHDFYYDLPQELIAQTPLTDRTASRLCVIDRKSGGVSHKRFTDIIDLLNKGDCLVINDTKVIPARLIGMNVAKSASVEILLLKRLKDNNCWEVLVKPGKHARPGAVIVFGNGLLTAEITGIADDGVRLAAFRYNGIFEEILDRLGEMPLPPYIKEKLDDKDRYQTVYASHSGSAAAPTAGLHFTDVLLDKIKEKGVDIAKITLHVGLGTFRPVKAEAITDHHMHSEFYTIEPSQAELINCAKQRGGRIIAVGTTSCRALESATQDGIIYPREESTDIFIYPGYRFKMVDMLITNFHLPESTLLMLVCALAGRELTMRAYQEAVKERYRFFSFGDCCIIL